MLKKLSIISILLFAEYCYSTEIVKQETTYHKAKTPSSYPINNPVPGGVAVIKIIKQKPHLTKPKVSYKNKPVMVLQDSKDWKVIVGLSLSEKPGKRYITIRKNSSTLFKQAFMVYDKQYQQQYITLKNKAMVDLSKEDLQWAIKDKKITRQAFVTWRQQENIKLNLLQPVQGRLSSKFGLKRFFNKKPRKPHSGLDIAAPLGSKIQSPADGIIITTGRFFFNGNVVFIDHGQGLVTMFCHMNKIDVTSGQKISRGEKIGEVGQTGRVTGPHLHFSVSLNNARVDPELFMSIKEQKK